MPSKMFSKHDMRIICHSHPQEVSNIYCKTCHTLVCCECLVDHHQCHELGTINDETRQVVQGEILHLLEQSSEIRQKMDNAREYIDSVEAFVLQRSEQFRRKITTIYKEAFDSLRRRQEQHLGRAEAICNSELKTVWAEKEHVRQVTLSLQSAINFAERNLRCGNAELLKMSTQVMSRLKELNTIQWDESELERVEFTASYFKSTSHDPIIGIIKTSNPDKPKKTNAIELQIKSIPHELPLGQTFNFEVLQYAGDGKSHPIGFRLPLIGVTITYGATNKKLSPTYININKKRWGLWEVSFIPVCGGNHEINIFMMGQESTMFKQTIKVTGRPWNNARVSKGPDYRKPYAAKSSHSIKNMQAVGSLQEEKPISTHYFHDHRSIRGEGRVRNSYYPFGRYHHMILVEWDIGGSCGQYRWGNNNYYDVELVI